MLKLEPQDVASEDSGYWANLMQIKLQRGVWNFDDHPYLVEPMQQSMLYRHGLAPAVQCARKAAQGGFSTKDILDSLHGMKYGHFPNGVLYLFPTADDMRDFSKARFAPLLTANPTAIGQSVKDTDTFSLKKIGDAVLYMRGATLSQTIESDAKESSKLRGITVDRVVYDEFDLMDQNVRGKAKERMGHSEVKEERILSNPTLPGFGVDSIFAKSDKRYWFRACLRCGQRPLQGADWEWYVDASHGWTSAEVMFPNNIETGSDGKGYIACVKCGKPLGLSPGCWVPKDPRYSREIWGYQWSQLTSKFNDPSVVLREYTNPPEGNLGDVVRFKLGLPYISAEDKLSVQQVMGNCGVGMQLNAHHGPCAMGVDIRRHKNVVIGCRSGKNNWRVVRVARVESMAEVLSMAYRFNVRIAVVDIRPYEDEVRQFQREAKFRTYLCEYAENTPIGTVWNDKQGIVKVNRNEIMDCTHRLLVDSLVELPGDCPEVRQFAAECANVVKVPVVNRATKSTVFRYRKLNDHPDDYRHALNYFVMAATSSHLPVVRTGGRMGARPQYAANDYQRC